MNQAISKKEINKRIAEGVRLSSNQSRYLSCIARGDPDECAYCGVKLSDFNRTIDHKIPLVQKGTNALRNLCLACEPCNNKKGNRTPEQWKAGVSQASVAAKIAADKASSAPKSPRHVTAHTVRNGRQIIVPWEEGHAEAKARADKEFAAAHKKASIEATKKKGMDRFTREFIESRKGKDIRKAIGKTDP